MSINGINNIYPLSANLVSLLSSNQGRISLTEDANDMTNTFSEILSGTLRTAAQADAADKTSALQLLTGQSDDLSGLLLDAQKAELSLNLALQIRNKVIDAYNEIIRMQV
jgi:flagellar hook-basal body complex protein FliE